MNSVSDLVKLGKLFLASLLVIAGQPANATWTSKITSRDSRGAIEISGYPRVMRTNAFSSIEQAASTAYSEARLRLGEVVSQELRSQPEYRSHTFWAGGPLTIKLEPSAGTQAVTLSGLSMAFTGVFKKSSGLITVTCRVSVQVGSLKFGSGIFDSTNGKFYGLKVLEAPVSRKVDCENNLSWVPIVGWLIDDYAAAKVNASLAPALERALNTPIELFRASNFMGLEDAIPSGRFMAGEYDLGLYLKSNLQAFFNGGTVTVFVQDPAYVLPPPMVDWDGYINTPGSPPVEQTETRFSIVFSFPGFSASFEATRWYRYGPLWVCPSKQPSCISPL